METNEQPTTQIFQVGNTAIQVQNKQFRHSYERGYKQFYMRYAHKTLFDKDVYNFLFTNLIDPMGTSLESAGYITGWMAALIEHRQGTGEQDTTTTKEVQ